MLLTSRRHSLELSTTSTSSSAGVDAAQIRGVRHKNSHSNRNNEQIKLEHLRYWNQSVGQPIAHLLQANSYSPEHVKRFRHFFRTHVAEALGESFEVRTSQCGSHWNSLMCDDGSPVEIGLAWKAKNTCQDAQVRFAIEPVDDDKVRKHGTNCAAMQTLINSLANDGHLSSYGKHLFHRMDDAVSERLGSDKLSTSSRTRYMIGFDLLRPSTLTDPLVSIKAYFVLPGLCSAQAEHEVQEPEAQLVAVLQAVSDVAPAPGLAQLQQYLRTLTPRQRGRPVILSVDLTPTPRVKVYWRFPDAMPQSIASHMDLGGLWGEKVDIGLTAKQAWSTLMEPVNTSFSPVTSNGDCYRQKVDPFSSTGGSLFYFDLSWSSLSAEAGTKPAPAKAYVPVRHLAASSSGSDQANGDLLELEIMRRCAEMLEASGRSTAAEAYLDSLIPFCRRSSHNDNLFGSTPVRGLHTYVCAEGHPNKPDICIYFKPHLLSPAC